MASDDRYDPMTGAPLHPLPVVVTDFEMRFTSMVGFMVKAAIAAIPALLILAIVATAVGSLLTTMFPGR